MTFYRADCHFSLSINQVNNPQLWNRLGQLGFLPYCTDAGYNGLQLLQSGFQPLGGQCSSVGFTLGEGLERFQSTLSRLDVAAVLLLCTRLLPSSLGARLEDMITAIKWSDLHHTRLKGSVSLTMLVDGVHVIGMLSPVYYKYLNIYIELT